MSSDERLVKLGFKFGKSGAHSARSLMYTELKTLLDARSFTMCCIKAATMPAS